MSDVPLIDHAMLATLREVMEDDFNHLLETYLSDSSERINAMQKALATSDAEALRRAAHSLKGSCSNLGVQPLMTQCQYIEQQAASGSLAGLECTLVTLQSDFSQVRQQLLAYL